MWQGKDTQGCGSRYHIVAQTLHYNPLDGEISASYRSPAVATIVISEAVLKTLNIISLTVYMYKNHYLGVRSRHDNDIPPESPPKK
jgi:hypothetical protein